MQTYKINFYGRTPGAIGLPHKIYNVIIVARQPGDIRLNLYKLGYTRVQDIYITALFN